MGGGEPEPYRETGEKIEEATKADLIEKGQYKHSNLPRCGKRAFFNVVKKMVSPIWYIRIQSNVISRHTAKQHPPRDTRHSQIWTARKRRKAGIYAGIFCLDFSLLWKEGKKVKEWERPRRFFFA